MIKMVATIVPFQVDMKYAFTSFGVERVFMQELLDELKEVTHHIGSLVNVLFDAGECRNILVERILSRFC